MTKSEARAIEESTGRALRKLEGTEMEWGAMSLAVRDMVYAHVKDACDEIRRVRDMAVAELGGGS